MHLGSESNRRGHLNFSEVGPHFVDSMFICKREVPGPPFLGTAFLFLGNGLPISRVYTCARASNYPVGQYPMSAGSLRVNFFLQRVPWCLSGRTNGRLITP